MLIGGRFIANKLWSERYLQKCLAISELLLTFADEVE